MSRAEKITLIALSVILITGYTSALDVNSSSSLNYYNDGVLDFQVDTTGQINAQNSLNLNGNSLLNYYGSACPSGEVMVDVRDNGNFGCVNVTSEVQDTYVNRNGDTMTGSLDMQNNNLFLGDSVYLYENSNNDMILQGRDPEQKLELTDGGSLIYREYTSSANNVLEVDSTGSGNAAVRLGEGGSSVNLDMSGNSITNYYGSACPSGEVMVDVRDNGNFGCVNVTSEVQDTYVNRNGDTMTGTLDINGNTVTDTTGTLTLGGGNVEVASGNLDIGVSSDGYNLSIHRDAGEDAGVIWNRQGTIDGEIYMNGAEEMFINNNFGDPLHIQTAGSNAINIDGNQNVVIPNGNLDMQSNTISLDNNQMTGEEVTFDGSTSTGLRVQNSNGYVSLTPLNSGWAHIYTDRTEFIFNKPVHTTANTFASYDGSLVLKDRSSGNTLTVGSSVQPSTNLNMGGNNITNFFGSACASGNVAVHVNDDGTIDCVDVTGEVQGDFVARSGDTMTGTLDMQGNNILQPGQLQTGGQTVTVRDSTNGLDVARFNEGGSVEIPNSFLSVNQINFQSSIVEIGNSGTFADRTNDIAIGPGATADALNNNGLAMAIGYGTNASSYSMAVGNLAKASGGDSVALGPRATTSGYGTTAIGENSKSDNYLDTSLGRGALATGSQSLALGSHSTASGWKSTAIGTRSEATRERAVAIGFNVTASTPGTVTLGSDSGVKIANGGLDMNGNSITNFFGTACASGNVAVHVNDDGTIDCVDATNQVNNDFVNRAGDTMTGTLDMQSNTIINAGSGNIDIGDGAGDINMNGNRIYGSSLGHFQEGGISGTLSNTQNNLDTLSANSFYVAGDIKVGGDFIGTGGDVAENVKTESETELEPGTVTTITGKFEVNASTEAYDTGVAGVVSTDPGVKLAEERDGVPLALTGIVPVKTTVSNGEIEPGDLLTTSDRKGYAMKCADPAECHGAIIGKAMESMDENGKVQTIVTLG